MENLTEDQIKRLESLDEYKKQTFIRRYQKDKKRKRTAYLLWFFLGCHHLYLWRGNVSLGVFFFYLFTGGLCGLWIIAEAFRIPKKVRDINEKLADVLLSGLGV